MRWVLAAIFLVLFATSFYWARKLTLRYPKWGNAIAGGCLTLILLHLVLFWYPMLEYALIPWYWYIYLQPWWMPVFAFGLLGAAMGLLPEKNKRRAVLLLTATLGLFYLARMSATTFLQAKHLTGKPEGADQVCHQTTGYTCGAAAAATLLAQVRITADEQEMADLCGTNSMNGTQVVGVMWGLREKLRGSAYGLEFHTNRKLADLQALRYPAMVTMKLTFLIDHWIVVIRADEQGVLTADPLRGLALRPTAEFMDHWRGTLVQLVPADPATSPPAALTPVAPLAAPIPVGDQK